MLLVGDPVARVAAALFAVPGRRLRRRHVPALDAGCIARNGGPAVDTTIY